MTTYKLTYFNITGRAESIRWLMVYGGMDWKEHRVEYNRFGPFTEWEKLKPSTPYGQLPILEFDGKVAFQTSAILRYLAKKVKLSGANEWEDLMIDAMYDTINDIFNKVFVYLYEPNPEFKAHMKKKADELVPYYLKKFEEAAKKNGGFLAVNRLTWVDFYYVSFIYYFQVMAEIDIVPYPNLKKLEQKVMTIPSIKKYVAE